jgi:ADP-dependent phosphofructokinase/glucokinase
VKADEWGKLYEGLIQRLPAYIREARLTLCGLSTFLDGYVHLHEAERLLEAKEGTPQAELSRELFRRASSGIGGEICLDWPGGGTWLEENLPFSSWGLGGTGAQAAQMLAILGAPALMSLEDRSALQLSVINPNILVATPSGVVRCGELCPAGERKPAHYIFEFTAGTQVGSIVPTRSSRTIVRFSDERLDNDPDFIRESITAAAGAGAGIVSGFNEIGPDDMKAALSTAASLARSWRDRGLEAIHLELGDFPSVRARDLVLQELRGAFTSFGLNHSELLGLCLRSEDAMKKAYELSEAFNLARLCVHADTWALSITTGDPQRELEALLCGCLFAAARAEEGHACRPAGVPAQAKFYDPPFQKFRGLGERFMVCCAAPYLERPRATIGLGDTFLAGYLLVLGGSEAALGSSALRTHI